MASTRGVTDDRVSSDTTTMVTNEAGTETTAGWPTGDSREPVGMPGTTRTTRAPSETPPPTISPANAPAVVRPRHQMPRTSNGQNVEAATANAMPTTREMSALVVGNAISNGTRPATTADVRKSRTRPRNTSVDSTPAAATTSPDDVDRNAAMAPAATSAASTAPTQPPMTCAGRPSSRVSA